MFIVMHCGGMPFNGKTIEEQSLGGSETAGYYMAKELAAQGHNVTMFTNHREGGLVDGVTYIWAGAVSQQFLLGEDFDYFATKTPHDVLLIQRHPQAFVRKYASKINLWWLHDLATYEGKKHIVNHMWNIDAVLAVSEFHKQQISKVWGIKEEHIYVIRNGVDLSLFDGAIHIDNKGADIIDAAPNTQINLLYASRPERGLEHLVAPDGIMERLMDEEADYHLYVCSYANNVPHMAQYYDQINRSIAHLPNVTDLGSLTKQELADVMRQCDMLVYPTPSPIGKNFEEVSCITAMECMAAGLPFISSDNGALPETCEGTGAKLIPLKEDGMPDLDAFINQIKQFGQFEGSRSDHSKHQIECSKGLSWALSASTLTNWVTVLFKESQRNVAAICRQLMEQSDIYALKYYMNSMPQVLAAQMGPSNGIMQILDKELEECYSFMNEETWDEHYKNYYQYEKDRGVVYGPESLDNNHRFECVADFISSLSDGSTILDYGCAHGHYTINLAKRFPHKHFIGIDIAASNIEAARAWKTADNVSNVKFYRGQIDAEGTLRQEDCGNESKADACSLDCIIAAEVIEHLADYAGTIDALCKYLTPGATFVGTTPYGPWEAQGYGQHWPWRAHVHHFDREDLYEMCGHHPNFKLRLIPVNDRVGSFVWLFSKPTEPTKHIDYDRKLAHIVPRQLVTLCMIAKDSETTILQSLATVLSMADQIIIGIDETTADNTKTLVEEYLSNNYKYRHWEVFNIKSPLEIGFDAARNLTLEHANGDWILWLDADETIYATEAMIAMFRHNIFDAYSVPQHHYAMQPLGVMKTDLPCRFFRNNNGIKFFGIVHEHPETALNEGLGAVMITNEAQIVHPAYAHETIRRERFERNMPLLIRDREQYPDRKLGKFLWLRDLAQMSERSVEQNGYITDKTIERAEQGVKMWHEIIEDGEMRLIVESLPFYSRCVQFLGHGFAAEISVNTGKAEQVINGDATKFTATFDSVDDYKLLMNLIIDEKTEIYGSKYYG